MRQSAVSHPHSHAVTQMMRFLLVHRRGPVQVMQFPYSEFRESFFMRCGKSLETRPQEIQSLAMLVQRPRKNCINLSQMFYVLMKALELAST